MTQLKSSGAFGVVALADLFYTSSAIRESWGANTMKDILEPRFSVVGDIAVQTGV